MKTESTERGARSAEQGAGGGGGSALLQRLGLSAEQVRQAMGTPEAVPASAPPRVENKTGRRRRPPGEWVPQIRQLRQQGLLLREIAARLGLSVCYVSELLPDDLRGQAVPATRHGQGRRYAEGNHPHQLAAQARLVEFRQQGLTLRQIAAKTGKSLKWVRQRLPARWRRQDPEQRDRQFRQVRVQFGGQ